MLGHATGATKISYVHIDEARLRPHLRQTQPVRVISSDVGTTHPRTVSTAAGDPRKLRGIPAIGRNVSGHIPGTRPDQITDQKGHAA